MVAIVALVTTLAIVDQRRAAAEALAELAHEQAWLAQALSYGVKTRAEGAPGEVSGDAELSRELLEGAKPLEVASERVVLLIRPEMAGLLTSDGRLVASGRLMRAFEAGERSVVVPRDEAVWFGLPRRAAVAGLSAFEARPGVRWGVVTVASAQRMRERQERADLRLLLGVLVVGASVLAFGLVALERQRRGLALAAELSLREVERERDEQLRRADKMATVAALSTGIAHEIATPLSVISAKAEQLTARPSDAERVARAGAAVGEQVERIHRVMRGFLTLARGESPALEQAEASRLLDEAMGLVRHRFEKREVTLSGGAGVGAGRVACDAPLLEQALVNLLLNACDACVEGGEVSARVRREGDRVLFEIDDDGVGMSAEAAARAVEPFFTTKPRGKGTGLGLTIAREIIKHHQGELAFEAGPGGEGTRVRVSLPAAG